MTGTARIPRRGEFDSKVINQKKLGEEHMEIQLGFDAVAADIMAKARPGQFVQIACRDIANPREQMPLLRRPFSLAAVRYNPDSNNENNKTIISIIYQLLGPGTKWLSERQPGSVVNITGPLGNGFNFGTTEQETDGRFILMGGGVGLPPLFFLAEKLREKGNENVIAIAGAQNSKRIIGKLIRPTKSATDPLEPNLFLEPFNASGTRVIIATDDGSFGFSGNAVMALAAFLEKQPQWQQATVYACGTKPMLRALAEFTIKHNIPCQLSLEEYMSCGIGLCQSCAVKLHHKPTHSGEENNIYKLVCTNGPVFDARKVVW